ncbi:hypothetical protein GGF46_003164 [Coemansia sp. RSA 552]|nr:hypothetical protein GGF46_003164 [Coemansia sp. RSA 552]
METQTATAGPGGESRQQQAERMSRLTREAWILDSLKKRRLEFLENHGIRAFVGTWNVNSQAPPEDTAQLSEWLGFVPADGSSVDRQALPELVVLGFQELDMSAEAVLYNNTIKGSAWTTAMERSFGAARTSYVQLATKMLVGMFIMVYVREDVHERVSGVQSASVGCGIMGMMGNKGAVAVRLVYMDTPLCFVCAHLAHDPAQLERRNAQFHDLCQRILFVNSSKEPDADPLTPGDVVGVYGGGSSADRPLTVFDHSYLVWLGDLNYRLAIDTGDMDDILARGEHLSLLGLDQLQIARMNKQAFAGFAEPPIVFAPTYKYVVGTCEYDSKRRPAWCDRVLWWTRPGCEDGIKSTEYQALSSICISDHKPVRARLDVDVWRIDQESRRAVYREVLRELDRFENECIPTAALSSTIVDYGDVHFGRAVRRKLSLSNSGQVPLEFSFMPTPDRTSIAPKWLQIAPDGGMLLPGQELGLEMTVLVDEQASGPLSTREAELYDILVLHLKRGRDYFVQVQGAYLPSVFGMSLDVLVHCKGAVRTMSRLDFEECRHSGQFSVPRCVWQMIDFLSRFALERGYSLFYYTGDRTLARRIKEWLDMDVPLDPAAILQWNGAYDEGSSGPAGHTVGDGGEGTRRGEAGGVSDGLGSSRMSMTDQTLVPSTMQSMLSDIDIYNTPSTAEALERLSLNTWEPVGEPLRGREGHQAAASTTAMNAGHVGAQPERRLSSDAETDSAVESSESAAEGGSMHRGESGHLFLPTTTTTSSFRELAGTPLPEAIAAATLASPHDSGVDTVASCLVELFRSLPEPLIPTELYQPCIEAGGISRAAALEALEILPPGNLNVLVYLLAFLREAIEQGATSAQRVAARVAAVFSRALLRAPQGQVVNDGDQDHAEAFLLYLLRSHGQI